MIRNWKTTLFGIATILFAIAQAIHTGQVGAETFAQLAAGFGLILGKDFNISGTDK